MTKAQNLPNSVKTFFFFLMTHLANISIWDKKKYIIFFTFIKKVQKLSLEQSLFKQY